MSNSIDDETIESTRLVSTCRWSREFLSEMLNAHGNSSTSVKGRSAYRTVVELRKKRSCHAGVL